MLVNRVTKYLALRKFHHLIYLYAIANYLDTLRSQASTKIF